MAAVMTVVVFGLVGTLVLGVASAMTSAPPADRESESISHSSEICPHCGAVMYRKAA
jgi:hypothetical protein